MRSELRYRQIHLDFHTSEHIPDVGLHFNKEQFIGLLKKAFVNSVTVFARCHHGWCYYPTKVGKSHPNLKRPDLLGEMVQACRENDINIPIYISVQWDERMAREHPEWRVMKIDNRPLWYNPEDLSAMNQLSAAWHPICLNNEEYVEYVIQITLEVMERYRPDGLFMDILLQWECVCPKCLKSMEKRGLDPEKQEHRLQNDRDVILRYYERVCGEVWAKDPDMRIFHNSGHIHRGERDRYTYFSHLELESLPTGGWGYDHFPVSARYVNTLGMEYLGMTGKFHTTWGEFGGFKRPAALECECAAMIALGARCSIGDQLHPSGIMDEATYETIRPAYRRVERIEPYLEEAVPESEIALLSSEAHASLSALKKNRCNQSDDGVARMLLEMQEVFDVIDLEADFKGYRLLILPDTITLDSALAARINSFLHDGGRLILSGASGMRPDESGFAIDIGVSYEGRKSDFNPDYIQAKKSFDSDLMDSPFVVYERAYAVKASGARVLAGTRVPYFNRDWNHFCSHQHTPYTLKQNSAYDAVIQDGNLIYFSHPIFRAYHASGQPLLKYLFRGALNILLPKRNVHVEMPSSGRVSLMHQKHKARLVLHLLFAQTQMRGSGLSYPDGKKRKIEIIEDVVPVYNILCAVRLESPPKKVYGGYTGKPLEFTYEEGYVRFSVDKLSIHEIVLIEYEQGK